MVVAVGVLAALSVGAQRAGAVALHALTPAGCVGDTGGPHGCGAANEAAGLNGTTAVAMSPDGTSLYATASVDSAVVHLSRAPGGALTPAGCVGDTGGPHGCGVANETAGLGAVFGLAVSPDGTSVYTVSNTDSAVARFNRAANGALTPAGCVGDTGGASGCGQDTGGLFQPRGVAVSPDGASVYVASFADGAVVRFNRAADGALTPAGCVGDTTSGAGCSQTADGLAAATGVAVSPDGASVYVAGRSDDAVVRLDRAADGALTPAGCVGDTGGTHGCGVANETEGLDEPFAVAVSPDGASVYAASLTDDAVVRLDRAANGALTPAGCVGDSGGTHNCGLPNETVGLNEVRSVVVSPDGTSVYAASGSDDTVVRLDRAANGALTPAGCVGDTTGAHGCGQDTVGLNGAQWVAVSPDGASAYAAGFADDAVVHLDREVPPRCVGVWSSGLPGAAQTIALDCFDPNGDPLEISIVSGPDNGTLGAVNQANDTVTYTPNAGFSGIDGLSFRSLADGKSSEVATATVQVQAAAGPTGPTGLPGPTGPTGLPGPAGEPAIRLLAILGLDTFSVRTGKRLPIRFATTGPGGATFEIKKGSRVLATIRRTIKVGRGSVTWNGRGGAAGKKPKALKPGKYTLALRLAGNDGQTATDSARLKITKKK